MPAIGTIDELLGGAWTWDEDEDDLDGRPTDEDPVPSREDAR